jgi:hypothetical protein
MSVKNIALLFTERMVINMPFRFCLLPQAREGMLLPVSEARGCRALPNPWRLR